MFSIPFFSCPYYMKEQLMTRKNKNAHPVFRLFGRKQGKKVSGPIVPSGYTMYLREPVAIDEL
jgi:hypothetical protein